MTKTAAVLVATLILAGACTQEEAKPCTALAEAKAAIAQMEVEAYTVQMEAYTGRAEEYSELREAVKLASRVQALSSLTEESTEAKVCVVLAEEYGERAKEATEWAEAWGVLAEEYEMAYNRYHAERASWMENVRREAENARNAEKYHAGQVEEHIENAERYTAWFEEYTEAAAAGLVTEFWRPKGYIRALDSPRQRVGRRISSIRAQVWRNRVEEHTKRAEREENSRRRAAENASKLLRTLETARPTSAAIKLKEDVAITRAWVTVATEQVEAFTALSEAYTALSGEDATLSELSIALAAEGYTALSKAFIVQVEILTDQVDEYIALADAYTTLA